MQCLYIAKPIIKDDKAIEDIRKAALIAQKSIDLAFIFCKSGMRTSKIDKEVENILNLKMVILQILKFQIMVLPQAYRLEMK